MTTERLLPQGQNPRIAASVKPSPAHRATSPESARATVPRRGENAIQRWLTSSCGTTRVIGVAADGGAEPALNRHEVRGTSRIEQRASFSRAVGGRKDPDRPPDYARTRRWRWAKRPRRSAQRLRHSSRKVPDAKGIDDYPHLSACGDALRSGGNLLQIVVSGTRSSAERVHRTHEVAGPLLNGSLGPTGRTPRATPRSPRRRGGRVRASAGADALADQQRGIARNRDRTMSADRQRQSATTRCRRCAPRPNSPPSRQDGVPMSSSRWQSVHRPRRSVADPPPDRSRRAPAARTPRAT
jgi:hypothetical protein